MKKTACAFILWAPIMLFAGSNDVIKHKVAVCHACHGINGISQNPEWPHLAGQNKRYFVKQLLQMQEGRTRNAPIMTPFIAAFNIKDMDDVATYYAKMARGVGHTPKRFIARGEALYRIGNYQKRIIACIVCHGPHGDGNAEAGFPLIAGQRARYTLMQLMAFKKGMRTNDLNHIMQDISQHMSYEEMNAVAHYIEGLR
jgi:cytochrome c553